MRRSGRVCLLLTLMRAVLMAQSSSAPILGQPLLLSGATTTVRVSAAHPGLPREATRLRPASHRHATQASGLSFAPAVVYNSGGDGAVSVSAVDINADGKIDLTVGNDLPARMSKRAVWAYCWATATAHSRQPVLLARTEFMLNRV